MLFEVCGERRWSSLAKRRVGPLGFITPHPHRDLFASMFEAGEQRLIEQFVTLQPIKAVDERVLGWSSRGCVNPVDFDGPTPFDHGIRGQLSPIVADDHPGLAARGDQIGQFAHH